MKKLIIISSVALLLAACAGRAPNPIQVVSSTDSNLTCEAIQAEIKHNNKEIVRISKEKKYKTAQNIAAGVGGLFLTPIVWFAMDLQGTQNVELRALNDRQSRLGDLLSQKCSK